MNNLDPIEFSRASDRAFNKLVDCFPEDSKWRLLVKHRLDLDLFQQVQTAAAFYVSSCLGEDRVFTNESDLIEAFLRSKKKLSNLTPNGMLCPKREHFLEFNLLHQAIVRLLDKASISGTIDRIHIPLNLRIVDGSEDRARDGRPYATNKLHSDVWAGEPSDAVVIHLPLFGDTENLGVEFGEMPCENEMKSMKIMEDYSLAQEQYQSVALYEDLNFEKGFIYFADSRLLHRTIRKKPGVRISVDFRFRLNTDGFVKEFADRMMSEERMQNYVSYREWSDIGKNTLVLFDETCEEAKTRHMRPVSAAKHPTQHRVISVF